jgi:hypothetical protein
MRHVLRFVFGLSALALGCWLTPPVLGQPAEAGKLSGALPSGIDLAALLNPDKKLEDFDKLVKGAKEYDGLFKLYQKEENLYAEIRQDQLDKPLLCPIAIAKGGGMMAGTTLNFDEQWVLAFKRVGDKLHLVRRNVRFKAKPGSPAAHAVETTYADSVLLALKIHALNAMRNSVVINLNDIFMSDFGQVGLGAFDAGRSTWHKVKAFPKNVEVEVAATFSGGGGRSFFFNDDSVIDDRGHTVVIHYGLVELPADGGYQPRLADPRVGYFLTAVKDFSNPGPDTSFVRYVNRWRLERADGSPWKEGGKLVPPKKKIVFWIEKSVPDEYRPYVREGILEWNKAFEKVGFRDAIEVRQQEDEDFDPEDISYSTFRWITTDMAFAMGPSRANPLTGEILDADILFDASWLQYWKQEAATLVGGDKTNRLGEPASPIQAVQEGRGLLNHPLMQRGAAPGWNDRAGTPDDRALAALRARFQAIRQGACQCSAHKRYEIGLAAMNLAAAGPVRPGEKTVDDLVAQAIKEVTMHEVGHTLGLRHNFKASSMLKNEQLHDTAVTRKLGLVGSVMDYSPVNLAPKGVKQGDYFTTTIGPYDYWAIEYGYKPLGGGTEGEVAELKKIASRGAEPGHDYGTDEDMMTPDPLIHAYDLGADPMQFGKDRMLLAQELLKGLPDRVVDNGEGYQRTRTAFDVLTAQYGNAAYLVASFVGGEHVHRDHKGDPGARDPFVPVPAAKQREALKVLQENLLTDKPFQFSPQLLRRLAPDRWRHWGNELSLFRGVEYPVYDRVLSIQRVALNQLLDAGTLTRLQDNALHYDKEDNPVTVAEVFRTLTDAIWEDLGAAGSKGNPAGPIIRRNLQREHLKKLTTLVVGERRDSGGIFFFLFGGSETPPDAKSVARMHLREIDKKIEAALKERGPMMDETGRAHLEECHERISKALAASMQLNEP